MTVVVLDGFTENVQREEFLKETLLLCVCEFKCWNGFLC